MNSQAPQSAGAVATTAMQRPLSSRAYGLARLATSDKALNDVPEELASVATNLAVQARQRLSEMVLAERGYEIGDIVQQYEGDRPMLVDSFQPDLVYPLAMVRLVLLKADGTPSKNTQFHAIDATLKVVTKGVAQH